MRMKYPKASRRKSTIARSLHPRPKQKGKRREERVNSLATGEMIVIRIIMKVRLRLSMSSKKTTRKLL